RRPAFPKGTAVFPGLMKRGSFSDDWHTCESSKTPWKISREGKQVSHVNVETDVQLLKKILIDLASKRRNLLSLSIFLIF
ncbi:hypothetical protein, partial [Brasilonema sp. UFV-L1]|uniref:hypothetical protein n=1 Tax=Brasilonema sp. UFV-L1 TaxID=2234130 RepID=UPI0016B91654